MIPQETAILLSFVNMKLRDEYSSMDELCVALDTNRAALEEKLAAIGYAYGLAANQFR